MKKSELKELIREEIHSVLNENQFELAGLLKEEINKGLDYYYSNSETAVRERARKIDAILNKEIKSDSTKVELLELIKEMMDEYAIEYHDSAKPY
jgi:hypothetical protein